MQGEEFAVSRNDKANEWMEWDDKHKQLCNVVIKSKDRMLELRMEWVHCDNHVKPFDKFIKHGASLDQISTSE